MSSERERAVVPVLLILTAVTGLVDAVSVLGLGRVFTANMTGNVVFLGFAAAGALEFSLLRSAAALAAFLLGAVVGGRIAVPIGASSADGRTASAFGVEAVLLLTATGVVLGTGPDLSSAPARLYTAIGLTGLAMGLRNAVVRKLAVADLTTTVLTLTLTGLAADSALAGGEGTRWPRRIGSVTSMFAGAAAGAWLVARSVALALAAAGLVSGVCAVMVRRGLRAD
jgi:uncharacterized membrane protein YoaK (UPF0700 family)